MFSWLFLNNQFFFRSIEMSSILLISKLFLVKKPVIGCRKHIFRKLSKAAEVDPCPIKTSLQVAYCSIYSSTITKIFRFTFLFPQNILVTSRWRA